MRSIVRVAVLALLAVVAGAGSAMGEDWKTYDDGEVKWKYEEITPGKTCRIRPEDPSSLSGEVTVPGMVKDANGAAIAVVEIANDAFGRAGGMEKVFISEGVRVVKSTAFRSCWALREVAIPATLSAISLDAFEFNYKLTTFTVAEDSKSFSAVEGVLFSKDKRTLLLYPEGRDGIYKIPEGTEVIGKKAFYMCRKLQVSDFPRSLREIGEKAFYESSVTSVNSVSPDLKIGKQAFYSCSDLREVTIGGDRTEIGTEAFSICTALQTLTISGQGVTVGDKSLSSCNTLSDLAIDGSVTYIGQGAFSDCTQLKGVNFPEGLIDVDESAFMGCVDLDGVTFPKSLESIGRYAFSECSFENVHIPAGVKRIEPRALSALTLKAITVDSENSSYRVENGVLFTKDMKTLVLCPAKKEGLSGGYSVPAGVEAIEQGAFNECAEMTSVTLPEGLKNIGVWAFSNCAGLREVTIPRSVEQIGYGAFYNCTDLSTVFWWPEIDISVDKDAFEKTGSRDLYVKKGEKDRAETKTWAEKFSSKLEGHVVIFTDDQGNPLGQQDVMYNQKVNAPEAPARAGYEFTGWDDAGSVYDFSSPVTSDITLKQTWKSSTTMPTDVFTVTFLSEGGTLVASQAVDKGGKVVKPADPVRGGHVFKWWHKDNSSEAYDFSQAVEGDITLKAAWIEVCMVDFYVNCPDGNATVKILDKDKKHVVAEKRADLYGNLTIQLEVGDYTYEVSKEYCKDAQGELKVEKGMAQVEITLEPAEHTVTFNAAGGTPEPAAQQVKHGERAKAPEEAQMPKRSGYIFWEWYLNDEKYDFSSFVTADITLEARWLDDGTTKKYTVTFDAVGGTPVPLMQFVEEGAQAQEPTKPEKSGFTFEGWYLNGAKYDFSKPVTADITLVAQWKTGTSKMFTVTFDAAGGTPVPAAQQVEEGAQAQEPTKPEKSGFTFEGWYLNGAKYDFSKPVTADITLVAQWKTGTAVVSALLASARVVVNPMGRLLVLEGMSSAERMEVYGLNGTRVHAQPLRGETRVEIDASRWASGLYVVRIVAKDGERALRVVKE